MLYVPILKYRQGEKDALYTLDDETKNNVLPLIEVTPDKVSSQDFGGVDEFWKEKEFILDVSPEYYGKLTRDEYNSILKKCNKNFVIPCLNLSDNDWKVSMVKDNDNGIAIRLYIEQLLDEDFQNDFKEFINELNIEKIDLIIDLKFVSANQVNEKVFVVRAIVDSIPNLSMFRRVILSSNSFPESLSEFKKYRLSVTPRIESDLYKKSKTSLKKLGINLIYSDYAVNHWSYFEFIPGMQPSFNIRYTHDDVYVIYKGETLKKGGLNFEKVKNGCDLLVESSYYKGNSFSWGDNEIFEKHKELSTKPGSLTTWRAICTSHHINFIISSLSNPS